MPSINDWAMKAANKIVSELWGKKRAEVRPERIAAIIATYAEPLMTLLRETKREHGYLCIKCTMTLAHGGMPVPKEKVDEGTCTCGADEWNARVDAVISGR